MNTKCLGMVLVASAACAPASSPDEPARIPVDNVPVVREELPSPPVDQRVSWLVHRGGWGDGLAHGMRLDLGSRLDVHDYDELIPDFSDGVAVEVELLQRLGDVPFIQSFGNFDILGPAVEAAGASYAVVNEVSPLALSQYRAQSWEKTADFLVRRMAVREQYDGYYRIDGRPVCFLFNISAYTPDEWAKILERTQAAIPGEDVVFIAQRSVYQVLAMEDSQAYMDRLMEVFDGIMFWGGDKDAKLRNVGLARRAIAKTEDERYVFWVLTNGYWRREKGIFMNPERTNTWRDQFAIAFENAFDGIIVESWNDFEENTTVAPTRENGGLFFDILDYYVDVTNGEAPEVAFPGLFLSHPREVLLGETLAVEILGLPVDGNREAVRLRVLGDSGETVYRSPDQPLPSSEGGVITFALPTRELADLRYLDFSVEVDGRTYSAATRATLRRSQPGTPWLRGVVLSKVFNPETFEFQVEAREDGAHEAAFRIEHDTPLSRVDLYRNDKPVWSLDAARKDADIDWEHGRAVLELDFQMPRGFADPKGHRSGSLSADHGRFVRGFGHLGEPVVEDGIARWHAPLALGRQFNLKLLADADEDTVFTLELDGIEKPFTFTLGDLRKGGPLERMTSPHGRLWIMEIDHPVFLGYEPGGLGRTADATIPLDPASRSPKDEYYLWAMDEAGNYFRSAPVRVTGPDKEDAARPYWFWDEVGQERFQAEVPAGEEIVYVWDFEGSDARVHVDQHGHGAVTRLGGACYRMGHFDPGARPSLAGGVLAFHGDDYLLIDSETFPQGAFSLDLRFRPEGFGAERQMLVDCASNLALYLDAERRVVAEIRREGNPRPEARLVSPEPVRLEAWNELSLRYDYETVSLTVNGERVETPYARGPVRRPASEIHLGARVRGYQQTNATQFFKGSIDEFILRAGAAAPK